MTDIERIVALEEKVKSLDMRTVKMESVVDNINSLTISVERFSVILSNTVDEMKNMNCRLIKIENEPRDTMKNIQKTIITALISGIVTAIFFSV